MPSASSLFAQSCHSPAALAPSAGDDCWGHDPIGQAKVYRAIKALDPHHVTAGAGGTSPGFSDGEMLDGHLQLSLDVPLIENYNPSLCHTAAARERSRTRREITRCSSNPL